MKTCVLCISRRNDLECTIRSRSRWNGVRTEHGSSSWTRPPPSYERTASGESHCCSSSRTWASKSTSDDDRNGAAVGAPGGAGHVRGAPGAEEHDHGRDLLGRGEPAERPARADLLPHPLAVAALLICQPPLPEP